MHAALVIMAAGIGSRYGGSKQTDGVGPHGEILMEYGVYDAVRAGFDKVVFIIKPDMRELMERLCGNMASRLHTADGRPVEVRYAYQDDTTLPAWYTKPAGRTKPFGTAHAVLCTRDIVHEPFCVINADYGADAYRTIYAELQRLPETGAAAMVGYLLKNTVTAHGTVSRGVCHVKDGYLSDIRETLKIALLQDGVIRDEDTGAVLDGDTVVSMNFWGFAPSVFDALETYFHDFLRSEAGQSVKAECLLPTMVGDLAAVLLAGIIVGAIFIIKGCKKDDAPADDAQNTNQPVDNVGDTTTPDNVIVDDELLTLVNPWNPLPDDWTVDLVTLDDGHRVDSRCYEAYMEMINACKAAGYSPVNCSSYRTQETQQSLYDNKVQRLISSGMSEEEAKTEAAKAVAIPGTSEHQLGLAVDLVDANMQDLTSAQESTETQKWLMANSWRYGFIHRYPNGKTDITGIIYEPWHYRYVGKDAAQEIFNRDITLEEYLGKTEH